MPQKTLARKLRGHKLNIPVFVSGNRVSVNPSEFKVNKTLYKLKSGVDLEVSVSQDHPVSYVGYLVLYEGQVQVILDEVLHDGEDANFSFEKQRELTLITKLFYGRVEPGQSVENALTTVVRFDEHEDDRPKKLEKREGSKAPPS